MASKVTIELNSDGVRELLRSDEMKDICAEVAKDVLAKCGDGYAMDTYTGTNRVNAMVYTETYAAMKDNYSNNTLLKAVGGK